MDFSPILSQEDRGWKLTNLLYDRLSLAANVEVCLTDGLNFVLKTIEYSGGMILVQMPGENEPALIVLSGCSEDWQNDISSPSSALKIIASDLLSERHDDLPKHYPLEIAGALKLPAASGVQGMLIIEGQSLPDEVKRDLDYMSYPLGRFIHSWRTRPGSLDRHKELATLQIMASTLGSNFNANDIQLSIMRSVRTILQSQAATLVLIDEDQEELVLKKTILDGPDWDDQVRLKLESGLIETCIHQSQSVLSNDINSYPGFNLSIDAPNKMKPGSVLACPMVASGKTLGAVLVFNKQDQHYDLTDRELLSSMATALANATYNMHLIQQLKLANADLEASRWELLRSRNTLRALFDNLPSSIYIVDRRYNLIAINMSRAERANSKPSLIVGRKCYQVLFQRNEPCAGCRVNDTLFGGQRTNRVERTWINSDQLMEWDISTYPIMDGSNQPVQAIVMEQDVTEKRRLEASLAQSEKLAAVGQLAAGVAHEINNPLAAIIANSQILERDLPNDPDLLESVKLIQMAGSRASQVVRNLLSFARKEHYEFSPTDINETIRNALVLLQHEFVSRPVDMIFDLADDLPPIVASKDHLQGVWMNLIMNAFDALENKPGEVRIITRKQGNEFRVTVADTGKGIPPDRVTRIFEPFYTTKDAGRGTGLGLSLCHRIVKQHGGYILVDSQVGSGTQFTVVLPAKPE